MIGFHPVPNIMMAFLLAYDPATNPLNTNEWAFPVCEVLHILGMAILVGTITTVDLRLLGLGLKKAAPAELWKDTAPWTLAGLALVLISGPLLLSSDPVMYLHNQAFRFKMTCLGLAIVYNYTLQRGAARTNATGARAVLTAIVSLGLWIGVVFGGIFIAFI